MLVLEVVALVPVLACLFVVLARDFNPPLSASRLLHDVDPAGSRFRR